MFRKIGTKLTLVVSITALLIIGIFTYFNIERQTEVLRSEVQRHANQLSETVKNATRFVMLKNERDYIQQIIDGIGKDPAINDVKILNKEGAIIYSSRPNDIGKMLDKQAESCYVCHAENKPLEKLPMSNRTRIFTANPDSAQILGIINPIYNEPSCSEAPCHAHPAEVKVLGVLDVTISLKDVENQIDSNEIQGVIFAVVAIVAIGFIIGIFVRKYVDKPVRELVNATEQVAAGNLNYKIMKQGNDELGKLGASFNDMTKKLDETSQQLYQSTKMASLGQLAAGVAHEINNPLTGVLTYSSFLLKRTKDNPQLQEDLNVIVRETLRSRDIVKGLLDFARQSHPKKSICNINEIIDRAIAVVNNQLKLKRISIERIGNTSIPEITADTNQIQQVFLNLFVNAIDAIGQDGKIVVTTSHTSLSPRGITQIKNAVCGRNHSLIDQQHKIGGMASLKIKIKSKGNDGFVHLDPVYGSHRHYFGINFEKGSNVTLSCPACDFLLIDKNSKCPECAGPVYKIQSPNQGFVEGCASFKDKWQRWSYVDSAGEKKFIKIDIKDSGCGIPQENLNKLFEPFFSTKGQRGTGLGLSVIWGIIDNHNGVISVQSEVGIGTTFTIRLPQEGTKAFAL
ncbi:MAG: integral membrane sensor signal transduction histidine kinase [Ignavibacteria bacterium]|nr:MAG: integral membrane sensor signal transduction histidine kinase [Ignavibacteria bacterium]KAF0161431.1 MAG: integral membrane sensor signal transduction histidine kinase [Ignavibacteria bacterium]